MYLGSFLQKAAPNAFVPPPNGFADFNADGLSFDPSTIDLGPPPDEDFSTLRFDDPPYLANPQVFF
jgi:hypothetical protein